MERNKEWWNQRSPKLKAEMEKNRLWYERGLKAIALGQPIRVEDMEVLTVVEDWKCESGEDRFESWDEEISREMEKEVW